MFAGFSFRAVATVAVTSMVFAACSAGGNTGGFSPSGIPFARSASIVAHASATLALELEGPLASAKTASVKLKPGGTTSVALPPCPKKGCTIKVTADVGSVKVDITILDAAGKILATSVPATVTVAAGKTTTAQVAFLKAIASLAWGAMPPAKAGTPFASPKTLQLLVKNADGDVISGTYSKPIVLADTDRTGATALHVSGGTALKITSSADTVTLSYDGLAIDPATLTAVSGTIKATPASFAPVAPALTYAAGSGADTNPEVDLYSIAPNTTGSSGAFTLTQAGWSAAPYSEAFTYTFAKVAGKTDDCPGTKVAAYAVTPASGNAGTSFTVSTSAALQSAPKPADFAGECTMTIAGGGGKTLAVLLTFTTSSVGVGEKHASLR